MELLLHSNRVITPDGIRPATIHIRDGLIQSVFSGRRELIHIPIEDLGDLVIMPGIIDPHVHVNDPFQSDWKGFDSTTKAAAAGGVTSIIDMPSNAQLPTTTAQALELKVAAARDQIHVNCGFWGGVVPGNASEMIRLLEMGALGLKAFLGNSGIDNFPAIQESELRKAMPLLTSQNLPLLVHCELNGSSPSGPTKTPIKSYLDYMKSRPESWEIQAIDLIIRLTWDYHCRSHITNLSAADALPAIRIARQSHLPISVETCPQYLSYNAEGLADEAPLFECAPPIRRKSNNDLLWEALINEDIDFIASGHTPIPTELDDLESNSFIKAKRGMANLPLSLPLIWTEAKKRSIGFYSIFKWFCYNPAQFLGLDHLKGSIASGYDADIVVWNPEETFKVTTDILLDDNKVSPHLNRHLSGKIERTYVSGNLVYNNGAFNALQKGNLILNLG